MRGSEFFYNLQFVCLSLGLSVVFNADSNSSQTTRNISMKLSVIDCGTSLQVLVKVAFRCNMCGHGLMIWKTPTNEHAI